MNAMKKANITSLDVEKLACKLTDLDYDEIDADTATIDESLMNNFGIDLDNFTELISLLLPMIDYGKSPLTNKMYKGFADAENKVWLIKIEV